MNALTARFAAQPRWLRRTLRIALWTIVALLCLAGLAAALLPGLLKDLAIGQIREQLQRQATIESISVNPFRLSLTVKSLAIMDRDGRSNLLKFDELRTRLGFRSIFRAAPIVDELALTRPQIRLVRLSEERYNITDIIDRLLAGPADPAGPRFALNSLSVTDGSLDFDDRPTGKLHQVRELRINLPELSAFEDHRNEFAQPSLAATINGDPFELSGRTKPFADSLETNVRVHIADVDVPSYLGYSPVALPVRLERGVLATDLDVAVLRTKEHAWAVTLKGTVRLDDLLLRDPAVNDRGAVAAVRRIDVDIAELRWPEETVKISRVAIDAPEVLVRRERDGSLNWQNMLAKAPAASPATQASGPPASPAKAAAAPATPNAPRGWQWSLADLQLTNGGVSFEDLAAPAGAFRAIAKPIELKLANLANAEGAAADARLALGTDAGEQLLHEGKLSVTPLTATGRIELTHLRLDRYRPYLGAVLAADLDGQAEVAAQYQLAADGNLTIAEGRIGGANLALKDKAHREVARIGALALSGIDVDLNQRRAAVGAVTLRQCRAALVRDAAGDLNVAALVKTSEPSAAKAPPASVPAAPGKDWDVSVKQTALERCGVQLDDLTTVTAAGSAARIALDPLEVRVDDWSLAANNRAKVDLRTVVNRKGSVRLKGLAGGSPPSAELDVAVGEFDIVPLQPYVADRLNVRVGSGAVSTRGKLSFNGGTGSVRYRGDANLARLATTTKVDGEDFLNWDAMKASGIDVAVDGAKGSAVPFRLSLEEVALSGFYSRLIVNADGTLNVQHVVRESGADRATSAAAAAGIATPSGVAAGAAGGATRAAASAAAAASPPAPQAVTGGGAQAGTPPPVAPITIGRVTLSSGRINFSDRFIKPNYSADILDVDGAVTGLSSDFATRAVVDIKGRYQPSAPVVIKGTINPLSGNLFVDIAATCRDVELVQFSPYSQKYAGYGITKGKLALEVKYLIENRKLTADNKLLLEQLTFGEKVDSPDATKLPVLFAVSLLKNAKGEIDLNLPISGSLDDPQFSVFAIVLKIIGNLLVKAATAPFALLGALVGGGEDLAYVDYAPGLASATTPEQQDKLAKIAKALVDRPGLTLDIAGRVDPVADMEALRRRALLRKLAAQRGDDAAASGQAPETFTIPPAEFAQLLKRAYDSEAAARPRPTSVAASGAPGSAPATTAPGSAPVAPPAEVLPAEMERALLAGIVIPPDALTELAERRANTVKNALVQLGVPGERMFIIASAPKAGSAERKAAPGVDFVLK